MANHRDDPIAGSYGLSKQKVLAITQQVQDELSAWDSADRVG
jgi:hypothetical protein